jgi:hypothetical protein
MWAIRRRTVTLPMFSTLPFAGAFVSLMPGAVESPAPKRC